MYIYKLTQLIAPHFLNSHLITGFYFFRVGLFIPQAKEYVAL